MVVLDQHHVEQADTMIAPTATGDGVFLNTSPSRSGLARIENLRARAAHFIYVMPRQRCNAGKSLDKI